MPLIHRGNPKGFTINRSHPAAKNCVMLTVPYPLGGNSSKAFDLVSRQKNSTTGSTSTASKDAYMGAVLQVTGTAGAVQVTGRSTTVPANFTFAAMLKMTTTGAAGTLISNNVTIASGLCLGVDSTNHFIMQAGGTTFITSALAFVANGIYFVAGSNRTTAGGADNCLVIRRFDAGAGALDINIGTTAPAASTAGATWDVMGSATTKVASWALAHMSWEFMPVNELMRWAADPWGIFKRADDWAAFTSMVPAIGMPPGVCMMPYITG